MGSLRIDDGDARVWFAYDVGQQIDLDRAQQCWAAGSERERIKHERRAPAYLQFEPAPLRLDDSAPPVAIGAFATDGRVEATLFDFGAVSISYRIPLAGRDLDELPALAADLDENPLLLKESATRVAALLARLGDSVRAPRLAALVEEYTVFHLRRWSPEGDPAALLDAQREAIARTLRAEREAMREGEVQDALSARIAYGPEDELAVDWNGAFLFDRRGEDTLAVLEFANVELLEMRFLDDRLDAALDRSYDVLRARRAAGAPLRTRRGELRESMRRVAELQLENALLYESVNNAIKMLGDQFLARVYRLAARRLHLEDWDRSILRKLETIDSIYTKLSDEHETRRMEFLEWIIIILTVVSIVLPIVGLAH